MKKLEIKSHTVEEIESILKSKEDYKTACRLVCILQIAKGESSRKAQELLLISHNQVCIWAKRFNELGIDGLKDKVKTGRKSGLSGDQLQSLKKLILNESPEQHGYNSATWTAPILSDWLYKECNIKYSDDNIYVLLKKKLNLRHKKGNGFYPEVDVVKRNEFSRSIKKTS